MDIERNSRNSNRNSFVNRMEFQSYRSSLKSLEKFSERNKSLSNKASLINAMDLESRSSKQSQVFHELFSSENICPFQRDSQISKKSQSSADMKEHDLSRQSNYKILHECSCHQVCNDHHCICYLTPNQICVIGLCCNQCIARKNEYLKTKKGYLSLKEKQKREAQIKNCTILNLIKSKDKKNMHYFKQLYFNEPVFNSIIFCTCKKSHCQKKYCVCFQKGVKCGEYCSCQECENMKLSQEDEEEGKSQKERKWEKYALNVYEKMQEDQLQAYHDIDQYLNVEEDEGEMQDEMEFQPVNFDSVLSNIYL